MLSFVSFRNQSEVAHDTKIKQAFAIPGANNKCEKYANNPPKGNIETSYL